MQDPLRYFIDEDFGKLYAFYTEEGFQLQINVRSGYKGFLPKYIPPDKIVVQDIEYEVNKEFVDKYTTLYFSEDAVLDQIVKDQIKWAREAP